MEQSEELDTKHTGLACDHTRELATQVETHDLIQLKQAQIAKEAKSMKVSR